MNTILNWLLFTPLIGALAIFIGGKNDRLCRIIAFIASLVPLGLGIVLLTAFDTGEAAVQLTCQVPWIKALGISYFVGVDGLSLPLVLLTVFLTTLTVLFSFDVTHKVRQYFMLIMLLETGMLGVFLSLDFFLFYLFWETVLIPMYFLILEWGGEGRRYAALKFFIYTHVASLVMLVGIIAMYFTAAGELGYYTFNILEITEKVSFAAAFQYLVFPALFFGFAVKLPIVPFHTWLPDAHVQAPTGGSILLAGILLKMGGYGLIRIGFCMMPEAVRHYALPMAILGVISMLYGAFLALSQDDLKKMIACSSISHMGLVLLGLSTLAPYGFDGAVYQMFAHGLISAMLFMVCGILQHTVHTRKISELGGVASRLPHLSAFVVFSFFASLGLPGLAGFISEFMVFISAFTAFRLLAIFALVSLLITAGYYLWALQRAFFGAYNKNLERHAPHDIVWYQTTPLAVLTGLIIFFGLYPAPIMGIMDTSSRYLLALLGGGF